jgi:hypothetical protein
MNKYFASLAFLAHTMFVSQTMAVNPFEKLTVSITRDAQSWADSVTSTLSKELQLSFLNLFALNAENSIEAFIKCAEYIESQPEMLAAYEKLSINIMQKIKKYAESVEEKISRKKNITKQEEESLWQKLEAKIQELVAYINTIYYNALYGSIAKKTSSAPLYMFDEKGIISVEKRTKRLPQPE